MNAYWVLLLGIVCLASTHTLMYKLGLDRGKEQAAMMFGTKPELFLLVIQSLMKKQGVYPVISVEEEK